MATPAGTNLNDPGGRANLLTLPDIGGLVETVGTGTPTAFLPPGTLPYPDVGRAVENPFAGQPVTPFHA
jgi:hypothetical protein